MNHEGVEELLDRRERRWSKFLWFLETFKGPLHSYEFRGSTSSSMATHAAFFFSASYFVVLDDKLASAVGSILLIAMIGLLIVNAITLWIRELRGTHRSWSMGHGAVRNWEDPRGEWIYSRLQLGGIVRWARIGLAITATWLFAVKLVHELPSQGDAWRIFGAISAILWIYRHLPTPYMKRPAGRFCGACGTFWPEALARICRRCGRVTDENSADIYPSLRRSFRWP